MQISGVIPLIRASKGATLSGASPDDLDESQGANSMMMAPRFLATLRGI
jgi:hypothetical protein